MARLLVNIDVPDLEAGIHFYTAAFGLTLARRLGSAIAELVGTQAPIYLLEKAPGTPPLPGSAALRDYSRHWSPVHLDFVVDDVELAVAQAEAAGARRETEIQTHVWGRIAMLCDPFGNGLCVVEMLGRGYDEIATTPNGSRVAR